MEKTTDEAAKKGDKGNLPPWLQPKDGGKGDDKKDDKGKAAKKGKK